MNFRQSISIISIVLATISIIWGLLATFLGPFLPQDLYINLFAYYDWQLPLYIRIFFFLSLFGIILGLISLKLKINKIIAIFGIIFSLVALLLWLFIWLWVVGWSIA